MLAWFDRHLSWPLILVACATLGLAPFDPEPHVWEKLKMLAAGNLVRPIDILDLVFHALPWLALLLKAARHGRATG